MNLNDNNIKLLKTSPKPIFFRFSLSLCKESCNNFLANLFVLKLIIEFLTL